MILPKKKTEREIWKSSNDIDKERYLDSSAQKELADYFERVIYDENLTASKRTKMLQKGLKFLRDDVELRSTDPRKQVFGDEK